jgi:hypothetical protein
LKYVTITVELSEATRRGLVLNGIRTIGDVEGIHPLKLQELAACSISESKLMIQFAHMLTTYKMSVRAVIIDEEKRILNIAVNSDHYNQALTGTI